MLPFLDGLWHIVFTMVCLFAWIPFAWIGVVVLRRLEAAKESAELKTETSRSDALLTSSVYWEQARPPSTSSMEPAFTDEETGPYGHEHASPLSLRRLRILKLAIFLLATALFSGSLLTAIFDRAIGTGEAALLFVILMGSIFLFGLLRRPG